MSESRREYLTNLLEDGDAVLSEFEGYDHKCFEGKGKALILAAFIVADAMLKAREEK